MRIKINPELCATCKKCCTGEPFDYLASRRAIKNELLQLNEKGKCPHLTRNNKCTEFLKPFDCEMYPILILSDGIYIDKRCPGWTDALQQFMQYASRLKKDNMTKNEKFEAITSWQVP